MPVDRRRTSALVGVLAIVLCAAAVLGVAAARTLGSQVTAAPSAPAAPTTDREAVLDYRSRVAPELLASKERVDELAREIDTEAAVDRRAERYGSEVLPRIAALLADAEAYRAPTARIAAGHQHAVAALRLANQAYQEIARSYRAGGDAALLDRARHRTDDETTRWRRWLDAVLAM